MATENESAGEANERTVPYPQSLMNTAFKTAVIIASVFMVAIVVYVFIFLSIQTYGSYKLLKAAVPVAPPPPRINRDVDGNEIGREEFGITPPLISASEYQQISAARLALSGVTYNGCGLLIGISLAFLGFALFLMGIKGDFDAEGQAEHLSVKFSRISPGAFAFACATAVLVTCLIVRPSFKFDNQGGGEVDMSGRDFMRGEAAGEISAPAPAPEPKISAPSTG